MKNDNMILKINVFIPLSNAKFSGANGEKIVSEKISKGVMIKTLSNKLYFVINTHNGRNSQEIEWADQTGVGAPGR